jgi:hypothetical protein
MHLLVRQIPNGKRCKEETMRAATTYPPYAIET